MYISIIYICIYIYIYMSMHMYMYVHIHTLSRVQGEKARVGIGAYFQRDKALDSVLSVKVPQNPRLRLGFSRCQGFPKPLSRWKNRATLSRWKYRGTLAGSTGVLCLAGSTGIPCTSSETRTSTLSCQSRFPNTLILTLNPNPETPEPERYP